VQRRRARRNRLQKAFVLRLDTIADGVNGQPLGRGVLPSNHNFIVCHGTGHTGALKNILFTTRAGVVVGQKYTLGAVPPPHQGTEHGGLSRVSGNVLRQTTHHEDERIQRVDPIRGQPRSGAERHGLTELSLVKHSLRKAPP